MPYALFMFLTGMATFRRNCRIIAASPEMLEALEGARWLIESYVADLEHSEEYQDVINAIKKARGKE